MLKNLWEHEVKSATDGLTTNDLKKLDPDQLHNLMEAQKDVDQRLQEVNKLVEDHGDAVDQLKNLFAGTHEAVAGPPGFVGLIGPFSVPFTRRQLRAQRQCAAFL
eukprot:symbB.v1.2.006871.t1/scaffold382.1/size215954/5